MLSYFTNFSCRYCRGLTASLSISEPKWAKDDRAKMKSVSVSLGLGTNQDDCPEPHGPNFGAFHVTESQESQ